MSTQIPLRIARSPAHAMRRQCLFQRRTTPATPRCIAAPSARAFSSTPARPHRKENRLVDVRMQLAGAEATIVGSPAPGIKNVQQDAQELSEDIGLLQNTIIRAPFSKLPSPASWEFYSYFWTLLKARFTALYTRSHFKRCVTKRGVKSYLPIDFMNQRELKNTAKTMYKNYYEMLAAGNAKGLRDFCLPPLAASLRGQIAARGPLKLSWELRKFKSARIVSHRCAPLGEDHPDTSYRQCVVRIESEQALRLAAAPTPSTTHRTRAPKWTPSGAQPKAGLAAQSEASQQVQRKPDVQTVVEYMVMQTRVVEGKEEDWKVWGFASESTPAKIEEDEHYWKRMLQVQAAA